MLEHRLSKIVAFATFLLLIIGGTVNATGSSLACKEPTFVCNGSFFPEMTGGVLYEHGHRLAAQTVGLLQIILTFLLIRRRPELKKLAWLLGGMVATQALLGAITVAYKLPWYVSTAHLMLAMSYFATLVYTAFRTRPAPSVVQLQQHARRLEKLGETRTWIKVAVGAIAIQLVLGALVRHHGAALACVGMPSCNIGGGWFPEAGIQKLHMIHRGFGVIVGLVTIAAAIKVLLAARSWPALRTLAILAPILVLGQIGLGIATVMTLRSVPVAVGHFAGATALWALWISALLLTRPRTATTRSSSSGGTLTPALVSP